MQTRLREEVDGDLTENIVRISDYPTFLNKYEIACETCNKRFFADAEEFGRISRAIREDLDNPFMCEECQVAYDDLSRER